LIRDALQKNPSNETLQGLLLGISPYAKIAELIDRNRAQEALDAINAIPPDQAKSKEVVQLRARALYSHGKQQVTLGEFDDALGSWAEALRLQPVEKVKASIKEEIVSTCRSRAVALQKHQRDSAIAFLEAGLRLVEDAGLKLSLADMLTDRAIDSINKAQAQLRSSAPDGLMREAGEAAQRQDWDAAITRLRKALQAVAASNPEFKKAMKQGLSDLERAVALGSKRATEQLQTAREINQEGLDATIKKNLAVCLSNRSGQAGAQAIEDLKNGQITPAEAMARLEKTRNDLREAISLDPSGGARENLDQLEALLTFLRNPSAHVPAYSSRANVYRSDPAPSFSSVLKQFLVLGGTSFYPPYPMICWLVAALGYLFFGDNSDKWIAGACFGAQVIVFFVYWAVSSAKGHRY